MLGNGRENSYECGEVKTAQKQPRENRQLEILIYVTMTIAQRYGFYESSSISVALLCAIHSDGSSSKVPPIMVGSISFSIPYS